MQDQSKSVTLRLTYPIVAFHSIEVTVSEEQALDVENMSIQQKAEFIIEQNEEKNTGYDLISQTNLEAALDVSYASIKRV